MLNHVIKFYFLFFLLVSCFPEKKDEESQEKKVLSISKDIIGNKNYDLIYKNMTDSFQLWSQSNLGYYKYCGKLKNCFIDSVLCFNKTRDRLITCILMQNLLKEAVQEDIQYFFGERISGKWYFFSGATIVLPREYYQNDIHKPIPYQKLHQLAIEQVHSSYLNEEGEINEDWFTMNFEGSGWGDFNNQAAIDWMLEGKRFVDKKSFFEFLHMEVIRNNWNGANKDSIKQLPSKTTLP